jgi:CheY-like chemotaxis protein
VARILVVDDDEGTLRIVQLRLERSGHEVVGVPDPHKALEMVLYGGAPDLVILDVSMPEISGLEVLQTLRTGFGLVNLPAVFLSARSQPKDIEAGEALGAIYLTKPFVASALLKAIEKALKAAPKRGA